MDKIRMGIIGCGGNMQGHLRRLLSFPEVQIVAIADPVRANFDEALQLFPDNQPATYFADYRAMLDGVDLDAVEISTPHTLHFEHAGAALDAGLHVFVEKPMVCASAHARDLIAKRDASGKQLIVGYQRHFGPAYRYCRDHFVSNQWPAPHFVTVWQSQNWLIGTAGKWRQNPALSGGGQLNDSGSHLVDILLWMTDLQPVEAFAYVDNRGADVDILTAASVRFKNGAIGNISVIGDSRATGMQEGIYLWHEKGMAEITGTTGDRLVVREPEERVLDAAELPAASTPDRNFVDAIRGNAQIESTAESALKVIGLTEAFWESAKRNAPVAIGELR